MLLHQEIEIWPGKGVHFMINVLLQQLTLWLYGPNLPTNSYTDFIKQIIIVKREDFLTMKICKYSGLIVQVNNSIKRT